MSLLQVAITIDQLGNTLLGGMADETISARAHRGGHRHTERAINWLSSDPQHCAKAYIAELSGSQNHQRYRK